MQYPIGIRGLLIANALRSEGDLTRDVQSAGGTASDDRDVFVSYASDDRARVSAIVQELKAHGFSVWLDVEQLRAGQQFDVLHEQIWRSTFFLAMLSRSALGARRWIMDEINTAIAAYNEGRSLTVIAVRLEPGIELPPILRSRKAVDLFGAHPRQDIALLVATLRGTSLPPTLVERFREFINGLPVVDRELSVWLKRANIDCNPARAVHEWFGKSKEDGPISRREIEDGARAMRTRTMEKLGQLHLEQAALERILAAIDAGTAVPFVISQTKNEVLSWLRHADGELIALAAWLHRERQGRAVEGEVIERALVHRWSQPCGQSSADSREVHSRTTKLIRRAVDTNLLEPFRADEYGRGRTPADDVDKAFHVGFVEVCRLAALFDLYVGVTDV
jgi:hypothetical protein